MDKTYTIKEISELFNIPKSTLRYWESEGIIRSIRNDENNYRNYSSENLIEICDIMFYRNLNLPIKEIHKVWNNSVSENEELFMKSKSDIENQINELQQIKSKIECRLENIKLYNYLKENPYNKSKPPFNKIIYLHLGQTKNVLSYINDQNLLAFPLEIGTKRIEHYGIASNEIVDNNCINLWSDEEKNKDYLECLIRTNLGELDLQYIQVHLDYIESIGAKPGIILAKYIISDKSYDYFQTWIEIN